MCCDWRKKLRTRNDLLGAGADTQLMLNWPVLARCRTPRRRAACRLIFTELLFVVSATICPCCLQHCLQPPRIMCAASKFKLLLEFYLSLLLAEAFVHAQWINLAGYIAPNAYLLASNCDWFSAWIRKCFHSSCGCQFFSLKSMRICEFLPSLPEACDTACSGVHAAFHQSAVRLGSDLVVCFVRMQRGPPCSRGPATTPSS